MPDPPALPCPPFTARVDLEPSADLASATLALPVRPGVFALEGEAGATILLGVTANVRRLVRARLAPLEDDRGPSRRIDYASLTRTIRALTVGSAFEADWAYLQHARAQVPHLVASLLDRWRGWFVHCNPDAQFPRFVKTCAPGSPPTGATGVYLGPFADKHAAARFIELLQDAFDLCRYHHILVEAPHATACAYKEMGKCPAPCDGTISMDAYRSLVRDAITFATDPTATVEETLEKAMHEASAALDFEHATRIKRQLEALGTRAKPAFRHVNRIECFRFLAAVPSERANYVRLFRITGGHVEPVADVPASTRAAELEHVARTIRTDREPPALSDEVVQNLGLVCWHLFRPAKGNAAEFVHVTNDLDGKTIATALRRLARHADGADVGDSMIEG